MEIVSFVSQSLYIWAILQTFLISLAIVLTKKGQAISYALFFIFISLESTFQFIYSYRQAIAPDAALYMFVYEFCNLLYGPLVLLSLLWSTVRKWQWRDICLHGALALVFLIHYFGFFVLPNQPFEIGDWLFTDANFFWLLLCALSGFGYFGVTWAQVRKNSGYVPSAFIKPLMFYLLFKSFNSLIVFFHMKVYMIDMISAEYLLMIFQLMYFACNAYVIVMTIFLVFRPNDIFSAIKISHTHWPDISEYESNIAELKRLMKEESIFAQPDINMEKLADMINVPSHVMSRILNEAIGMSFWDYMNVARIDLAKELLRDTREKNLSVALKCGYNSESVFYRNFRKITGLTPGMYQEIYHQNT